MRKNLKSLSRHLHFRRPARGRASLVIVSENAAGKQHAAPACSSLSRKDSWQGEPAARLLDGGGGEVLDGCSAQPPARECVGSIAPAFVPDDGHLRHVTVLLVQETHVGPPGALLPAGEAFQHHQHAHQKKVPVVPVFAAVESV